MKLSEEKEKELVEKVELRFVLSDTPEKYQQSLNVFLPPLLLKLASEYSSVKQAVFNILKDVLSRLNTLSTIELPVDKLLDQAKKTDGGNDPDASISSSNYDNVRLYSLLFVSKGIDRINNYDFKKNLIPKIMDGISKVPLVTASRLFHILCKLLLTWKPPLKGSNEEDEIRAFLSPKDEKDMYFVLDYFTKFFLLNPAKPDPNSGIIPRGYSCPGLSPDDVAFFTYNAGVTFTKEQMVTYKSSIFKFVTHGFVPNDQLLIKFLSVASTDSTNISDSATQILKTLDTPYEDSDFIEYLISLYVGDNSIGRPPVKHELQEKILTILNRSEISTHDKQNISLICSIGLHSKHYKLRSLCLTFISFVSKHNHQNLEITSSGSNSVPVSMASLIRNNLNTEGWPKLQLGASTPNFNNTILQRRLQYETLGVLLKKDYTLVEDLSYIEFLFDSLKGDLSEFRSSIQEALNSLTIHLYRLPAASKEKLKKLIASFLCDDYQLDTTNDKDEVDSLMACRYVCIKYSNAAFDFNDSNARYFNTLGTSRTNRFDIIEEAYKGLNPYWFKINWASNTTEYKKTSDLLGTEIQELPFPDISDFLKLVLNEVERSKSNSYLVIRKTLNTTVRFIKQIIISSAVLGKNTLVRQDEDWSIKIEKSIEVDKQVYSLVSSYIKSIDSDYFISFLDLLHNEFVLKDESNNQVFLSAYQDVVFGQNLLFMVQFCNITTLNVLAPQMKSLFNYLRGINIQNNSDLKIAANVIGILSVAPSSTEYLKEILSLLMNGNDSDDYTSVLLATSYIIPRLYMSENYDNFVTESYLIDLVQNLINMSNAASPKINPLESIAQILKYGTLLKLNSDMRKKFIMEILAVVKNKLLKSEKAIEVIGYISLYSDEFGISEEIFDSIYQSHTTSQVELHFSAGEALSILFDGWSSGVLENGIDIPNCETDLQKSFIRTKEVNVINKILDACDHTKPSLRKASCIWLLSIVRYSGSNDIIKENCELIHLKFMRFLADRDDFVQESASKGLSLVYELGNVDLKESMVKGLLRSFTDTTSSNKLSSGSVSNNTQLFEEGVLNTGNDSVKTYKDILSLASEVGDPSLVYKFMNLAKSSSLWSSRKGIAFGLGAIMSKSSLEEMLLTDAKTANKLIPKLFRYRFDPSQVVANSMNDIWNTLISDSSEITNIYFDAILEELLAGMSNREWRVREASTKALLNILQTMPKENFTDKVIEIWTMSFRTMDDIKESVRQEGTKLTNFLAKLLARSIDVGNGVSVATSEKTLKMILPFLLGTKGLNSDAEDIRTFALKVIVDLVKNTGTAMKQFAPDLVYQLTLLFSSIEPEVINYLSLNANNFKVDAIEIDTQRSNVVASSPLFTAIESLISMSDDSVLEDFVTYSIKAIRKSIGLPSKIAASSVVILLIKKYQLSLKPYSGKLLKSCFSGLSDRNGIVNQSFATTFGHITRISSLDKVIKYSQQLVEKYFAEHSPEVKIIVSTAISAMIKYAPSEFRDVSGIFIPLIFLATNDSDETLSSTYNELWTEASSLGSGTIKLYLNEIIELLSQNITSTDFAIRKSCAKSVSSLTKKIDSTVKEQQVLKMFTITLEALHGRSWDGKEEVVAALVELVIKFKGIFDENQELKLNVIKAMTTEISKKNQEYVKKVILSYSKFLKIHTSPELITLLTTVSSTLIGNIDTVIYDEDNHDLSSSSKRIKTHSEITKISTKTNIEKEEFITKLLLDYSEVCKFYQEEYPMDLLNFILNQVEALFKNSEVIFTWRTNLAATEIGIKLLENYNRSNSTFETFEDSIKKYWDEVYQHNSKKESIENVKLGLVHFAKAIMKKLPELRVIIEKDMIDFTEQDLTPRIISEIQELSISTS